MKKIAFKLFLILGTTEEKQTNKQTNRPVDLSVLHGQRLFPGVTFSKEPGQTWQIFLSHCLWHSHSIPVSGTWCHSWAVMISPPISEKKMLLWSRSYSLDSNLWPHEYKAMAEPLHHWDLPCSLQTVLTSHQPTNHWNVLQVTVTFAYFEENVHLRKSRVLYG